MNPDLLALAETALADARRLGATAADVLVIDQVSTDVTVREGGIEALEQSAARELGLRVFIGAASAIVSGSLLEREGLTRLAERAVAMARGAPPDPFSGLAEAGAAGYPDLDLSDPADVSADALRDAALAAEAAALGVAGVSKSGGASASQSRRDVALLASNGFAGGYRRSGHSIGVSAIAGSGTAMERDYDYSSAIHAADLDSPESIGRSAGERAMRRINPRKVASCRVPVIYDRRVAASLVGHVISAILGSAVARGTSFLKDALGTRILPPGVDLVDDPLRRRGLASRPFDAEGLAGLRRDIVKDGILQTWLLDLRSARQLGLKSTAHASRGVSNPPQPSSTNLNMAPGTISPRDLMAGINQGFYVTELIGSGLNMVTGDYSRGASGFWIEKGELAFPVSEVTLAGNLKDMLLHLTPANDLMFRNATNAPACRVEGLTLAGT